MTRFTRSLLVLPLLVPALASSALGQGATCATPIAISGTGTFVFNTTGMTTSGFNGGGSCSSGASSVNQDGFFLWTAPASGGFQFDTNGSTWDTKLSVHGGSDCAASCLEYNDDGGEGTRSLVYVSGIVAGQPYLVQVGGWGTNSGVGQLNITEDPCGTIDGFEDNDSCAAAVPVAPGTYPGLVASPGDQDFYEIVIPPAYVLNVDAVSTNGAGADFRLYDGGCNFLSFEFDPFLVQNTTSSPMTLRWEVLRPVFSDFPCTVYDLTVSLTLDNCQNTDALDPNDTCGTAQTLTNGTYTGLIVSTPDPDFYRVLVPPGEILQVTHTTQNNTALDFGFQLGSCSLGTALAHNFYHVNPTGSTQTVTFEPYNTTWQLPCAEYELTVWVGPNPCDQPDDGLEPNDTCALATPVGNGFYPGLTSKEGNRDVFAFVVDAGATVNCDVLFDDVTADVDAFLYLASEPSCGQTSWPGSLDYGLTTTDNEFLTWTNTTGMAQDVRLEVAFFGEGIQACNQYDLVIAGTGTGALTTFCDPMDVNSTGQSTLLTGVFGTGQGAGLRLEGSQGPEDQFGYFLLGTAANDPGVVVSQGRLCLSGQLGRFNVGGSPANSLGQFNVFGILQNLSGTSSTGTGFDVPMTLPLAGNPTITPGSTWHFQLWHRETSGSANFSNGLSVMF